VEGLRAELCMATTATIRVWPAGFVRFRDLMLSLAWRDLRVRYKQSLLGIVWAVLVPFSMMLIFTFVFTRAVDASSVLGISMPYALYAYSGLVPWTFFAASLSACVSSLVANRNLVTKVYFPREVFPLSCVAGSFVDFCVAFSVLAGLMLYFQAKGDWTLRGGPALFFVPVVVTVQIALTVGLGLLLAMANLFYRDVRQIFGAVIQLAMFVSAVVVPVPKDGSWAARVVAVNPMIYIIGAYRDCILEGQLPGPAGFTYAAAVSLFVLAAGWFLFRRAADRFAECI